MITMHHQILGKNSVVPNTFIGGIGDTINTPELLAQKIGLSVNDISKFTVNGTDISFFIKGNRVISGFRNDSQVSYIESTAITNINPLAFRDCANLKKIDFPNLIGIIYRYNNYYAISAPNLEYLNLGKIIGLQSNYINNGGKITELILDYCTICYAKSIRNIPQCNLIRLRKCKELDTSDEAGVIFTGLKATVRIELNSYLLTNNNGGVDAAVLVLKSTYPNSTIAFYDDNGNYVSTL